MIQHAFTTSTTALPGLVDPPPARSVVVPPANGRAVVEAVERMFSHAIRQSRFTAESRRRFHWRCCSQRVAGGLSFSSPGRDGNGIA
jgi:hypothetical protein